MLTGTQDYQETSNVAHPIVLVGIILLWSALYLCGNVKHPKKVDKSEPKLPLNFKD